MKKTILFLLLTFCFIGLNTAQDIYSIDPELQQVINQKGDELISINIIMKSQIDADKLDSKRATYGSQAEKRATVLKEFKNFSEESQASVMSILKAETRSSRVANIKCHWIANIINCEASRDVIYQLSKHSDVETIIYNKMEYMLFDEKAQEAEPVRGATWSVTKVNADDVWALGYTGKGVTVAVLDTGVNTDHVDLKDHLWDGGSEYPNHGYNTMDNNNNVSDKDGHGTHVAGIIAGDGTSGTQTGIAPDATLMCIKVLGDDGMGNLDSFISGIEFSAEHGADVINLSLGSSFPNNKTNSLYRTIFTNLLELDILGVAAAGNDKDKIKKFPVPKNINAPASCPPAWIHPDQQSVMGGTSSIISVGAIDNYDRTTYFSSVGPVTWLGSEWDDYSYDKSSEIDDNWLCYDRNYFTDNIGNDGAISWGIMFPPSKLEQYAGGTLTKISTYDHNYYTGTLHIYQGGNYPESGSLMHSQSFVCNGTFRFVDIVLDNALPIDHTQNLWIIIETEEGIAYPATSCPMTDDPNGRWFKYKGVWSDITKYGHKKTWTLRAFIETDKPLAEKASKDEGNSIGLIRPDVVAPGLNIISCANYSNNEVVRMDGTSMATPCVTGIVALMKEKNPDITPAEICEILETTAYKLTATKDNKTGSGRVDALAAIKKMGGEDEEGNEDENVQDTTSINENRYNHNIKIYPNPVKDELILATETQIEEIAIYDIYGRTVSQQVNKTTSQQVVNVADLEAGIYFINIKTDNGNIVKRFIKN